MYLYLLKKNLLPMFRIIMQGKNNGFACLLLMVSGIVHANDVVTQSPNQPANQVANHQTTNAVMTNTASTKAPALRSDQDSSFGSLASSLASSLLMLLLLGGGLWYVRHMKRYQKNQHLKTVASLSIGGREKIVVVEFMEQWLVLGVTNQQINVLHKQTKPHHSEDVTPIMQQPSGEDIQQTHVSKMTFSDVLKKNLSLFRKE